MDKELEVGGAEIGNGVGARGVNADGVVDEAAEATIGASFICFEDGWELRRQADASKDTVARKKISKGQL